MPMAEGSSLPVDQQGVLRVFNISQTKRASEGHTVYRVSLTVIPPSSPEVVSEVSVWRRYSEFSQLHRHLHAVYTRTFPSAKNSFPVFPRAKYFGRFDDTVIQERRKAAIQLLRFAAGVPELLNDPAFLNFFRDTSRGGLEYGLRCGTVDDDDDSGSLKGEFQPAFVPPSSCHPDSLSSVEVESLPEPPAEASAASSQVDLHATETEEQPVDQRTVHFSSQAGLSPTVDMNLPPGISSLHPDGSGSNSDANSSVIWQHKRPSPAVSDDGQDDSDPPTPLATDGDVDEEDEEEGKVARVVVQSPEEVEDLLLADLSMIDSQIAAGGSTPSSATVSDDDDDDNDDEDLAVDKISSDEAGTCRPDVHRLLLDNEAVKPASPILGRNRPMVRVFSPGEDVTSGQAAGWWQNAMNTCWNDVEASLNDNSTLSASPNTLTGAKDGFGELIKKSEDSLTPSPADRPQDLPLPNGLSHLPKSTSKHITDACQNGRESLSARVSRAASMESVTSMELSDYVIHSAKLISAALEAEASADYAHAFDLYKSGVGLLLSGVQTDSNQSRREAVRRKTAQYLQRAETIHQRYLSNKADFRWENVPRASGGVSTADGSAQESLSRPPAPPAEKVRGDVQAPSAPVLRLRDFGVLRPAGKTMLVQNKHTSDVYVIKTLYKTLTPQQLSRRSRPQPSQCLTRPLCPFMVRPVGHFETTSRIFILLEYAQRGCLWDRLEQFRRPLYPPSHSSEEGDRAGKPDTDDAGDDATPQTPLRAAWPPQLFVGQGRAVPESRVQRWASEMVVALAYLHNVGIIWRDLQPKNILLSETGGILLTYSGCWENVQPQYSLWACEHLFVAPELHGLPVVTNAADWWSIGAILYELLTGKTLLSCHPAGISSHSSLYLPPHLSSQAASLLQALLQTDHKERLGAGSAGVEEIKSHPFFSGIHWQSLSFPWQQV